jgi:CRP/FNR family cyclic AMP-dependent transcriptional regulator
MPDPKDARLSEAIDDCFIFRPLDDKTRQRLRDRASLRKFFKNKVIIKEGDHSDELYIILSGKVAVSTELPNGELGLAELGKRVVFGEVAAITGSRRTSTVKALEPTEVAVLPGQLIREVSEENPRVKNLLLRMAEGRALHAASRMSDEEQGNLF